MTALTPEQTRAVERRDASLLVRAGAGTGKTTVLVERFVRAVTEDGAAVECELYECSEELLERLAHVEPPGWNRAPLELEDGRSVEAFVGDPALAARGVDVSEHGSWAAFVSSEARLRARGPTPR